MIFPDIFSVVEPASVKVMTGSPPLDLFDLYPVLESVTVQVSRSEPGVGKLVLSSIREPDGSWPVIDGDYFDRWKPIRVVADFGGYSEDVLWGYVVKVSPEYPTDQGAAKVTVEFQDETIALDREQITRTWGDNESDATLTDKSILQSILANYGLSLEVSSDNGQTQTTLNQDKTDMRFISELAEALGHELRIMFGRMYFGPINFHGAPQHRIQVYAGPDTNCVEFAVEEESATPDEAVTASVDSADSGETSEVTLQPDLPILGSDAANSRSAHGVPPYVWRLRQEGDNNPAAAQTLAQAKVNEASLSIKAQCQLDATIYGHVLLPGKLVTVDGVGERYGGRFYVDAVEHTFDAGGYIQKASLLKNGIHESGWI